MNTQELQHTRDNSSRRERKRRDQMNTQELQQTRDNDARRAGERQNRLTAQQREQDQQANAAQMSIACAELTPNDSGSCGHPH